MTRRQRQVSDRWGSSVVRAPQAAEATTWDGNSRWSGEASGEWAASPAPAYGPPDADRDVRVLRASEFGAGAARANGHEVGVGGEQPGPSPVSAPEPAPAPPAYDLDGMQRSIQWVVWAVEECSRAYTRINGRLGDIERRLGALEAADDLPAGHADAPADAHADASADAPGSDVDAALEDLASRLAAHCTESAQRFGAVEQRLRELDYVPLKVSNLQRQVDRMAVHRSAPGCIEASEHAPAAALPPAALNAGGEPARLRHDLETIRKRVQGLEARSTSGLAEAVEQAVRAHLAGQGEQPSAAGSDVEGLYRELDHLYEALHVSGWSGAQT